MFVSWPQGVSTGGDRALRRPAQLHQAIVDREEQGETLCRLLPGGLAEKLRNERRDIRAETERLDVTVLMSDIRVVLGHRRDADPSRAGRAAEHAPARR